MASWITYLLSFFWFPASDDDLSISRRLLRSVPLQRSTRYFTLALKDPQRPGSVLYILSTVLLSEQSALDAHDLINAVKPDVVVAQVGYNAMDIIDMEHLLGDAKLYPRSVLQLMRENFHDGNTDVKYMKMAQADVMKAIFGTTFMGHIIAAKQAAKEFASEFLYLQCARDPDNIVEREESYYSKTDSLTAAHRIASSLGSSFFGYSSSKLCGVDLAELQLIASQVVSSYGNGMASENPTSDEFPTKVEAERPNTERKYECPEYAQVVYPFLLELHNAFHYLPGIDLAIERTQKLLTDVAEGAHIDHSQLSMCQCFRLAAEGLRVALNSSAHAPLKLKKATLPFSFDELPYEDKCYVLLAQALKQKLQESQSVVAILDAGMVAGIRKYWAVSVPHEVVAMASECLISEAEDMSKETGGINSKISGKPIIIVGAGAAAAVGVASVWQWAPASTAMKVLSFKAPTIFKLGLLQGKKGAVSGMVKAAHPLMKSFSLSGKGFIAANSSAGSKMSIMKAVASSGNIRNAAHSVVASAQKYSYSAIRTAFYNVMQNRHRKDAGRKLWLSLGVSIGACAGLLAFGEGIENVVESFPKAYSLLNLCRGVRNLSHASNELMELEDRQYWESLYVRLHRQS